MFEIPLLKRNTKTAPQAIEPGDIVSVDGMRGVFIKQSVSPYYIEECAGIMRAYVVFPHNEAGTDTSADYVLVEDVKLIKKGTAITAAFAEEIAA